MSALSALKEICEKCEVIYNGEKIEKTGILQAYSYFLISCMESTNNQVCVSLHTGSLCYDMLLMVYSALLCIYSDDTTANDIVSSLKVDNPIIYGKSRAIFKGFDENGFAIIYTERKDHGMICYDKTLLPPKSFSKIKPYNGLSKRLDGRGLHSNTTERNKFIKKVFSRNDSEIAAVTQKSIIVLASRNLVDSLMRGIVISYDDGKKNIKLTQLVTASYFTESDEYRYSGNAGKNDSVLKFMSKSSLAREMVINDEDKVVIGILVMGKDIFQNGKSELLYLLKRKSITFKCVGFSIEFDDTKALSDDFDNISLFACTNQLLKLYNTFSPNNGILSADLHEKIGIALNKQITPKLIDGFCDKNFYELKQAIYFLKNNCEKDDNIEQFVIYSLALINLFTTAIFPIEKMELMIERKLIICQSPIFMLDVLERIKIGYSGVVAQKMNYVGDILRQIYNEVYYNNPKCEEVIYRFKYSLNDKKWAIVVPKLYYKTVFESLLFEKTKRKFNCYITTASKFDSSQIYDEIIIVGQLFGKKFDIFCNLSSDSFTLLQYNFESKQYKYRLNTYNKLVNKYNNSMSKRLMYAYTECPVITENTEYINEKKLDTSLQEFIDSISFKHTLQTASLIKNENDDVIQAEIYKIANCTNGETIFFTKYFIPYIIDYNASEISEGDISEISSGDTLLFNKNNSESQDIVDDILLDLLKGEDDSSRLLAEQYQNANHWKKILRKYMNDNKLSFKDVSSKMKSNGVTKHEVTLRTWLNVESHIVGPRDAESYRQIALLCEDKDMMDNPEKYFESCNVIRTTRIKILKSLGNAVIKNYIKTNEKNEFYEYIAARIDDISEVVEIETIIEPDNIKIPAYMVNKPQYI